MYPGQRIGRNHVAQHFNRVVLDDAQIGQPTCVGQLEQAADPGGMDFDAEVVDLWVRRSNGRSRLAHAEADFQDLRPEPGKYIFYINRLLRIRDPVIGQKLFVRTRLGARYAALAQNVTANRALWIGFRNHGMAGLAGIRHIP